MGFIWGFMKGAVTGVVIVVVVITVILSWASEAGEVRCRENLWGEIICDGHGFDSRYVIKQNIWQEDEIRRDGKLIARCKPDVFGDLVCREED